MIITDEKLVQNYIEGQEKALEALVDRYLRPLYNFVFQLVRDENITQDIVQEVFVKVWKHISSFDANKKFSTWIFAIAKNAAFDYLKKKKTIPFSAFENEDGNNILDNFEDENVLHSNALLQKMDDIKSAQELLDALSPKLRTILLLHHKHGFSLIEIAEIFGTPANTIKSNYRRALIFLKNISSSNGVKSKVAPETISAS